MSEDWRRGGVTGLPGSETSPEVLDRAGGRRIANPPQVNNLPHKAAMAAAA